MGAGYDQRSAVEFDRSCDPTAQTCPPPETCGETVDFWTLIGNSAYAAFLAGSATPDEQGPAKPTPTPGPAQGGALDLAGVNQQIQSETDRYRQQGLAWLGTHPEVKDAQTLRAWTGSNGPRAWEAWRSRGRVGPEPEKIALGWGQSQAVSVLLLKPELQKEDVSSQAWSAAFWSMKCLQYAEAFRRHLSEAGSHPRLDSQRTERDQDFWWNAAKDFDSAHPEARALSPAARHALARAYWWKSHYSEVGEQVDREGLSGDAREERHDHLLGGVERKLKPYYLAIDQLAAGKERAADARPAPFASFRGLTLEELGQHLKAKPQDLPVGAAIHVKIDWHQGASYHTEDAGHHWVTYVGKGRFADSAHPAGAEGRTLDRYVSATLHKYFPKDGFRHLHNEKYATQDARGRWNLKPEWKVSRVSQIYPP